MNIVVEDPKVRPGGALYIRKNIFSVSCVVNKAKDMAKSTPVGGGRNPAANGRVCRWFLLRLFRSAHAMPKGMRACQRVPSFSIVVWETPSTTLPGAYTRAPRTQPLGFCFSLLPKPNQTPGEQGSWRAARFAAQVRSAQHGASGQKRGSLCTAWCRVRILWQFAVRGLRRLGARGAPPWGGKKKGGSFFYDDRPEHARGTSGPARVNRTAR